MAKIGRDAHGLFVSADGWKARPHPDYPSCFNNGDSVVTKHFGGSMVCGIDKLPGRGKYKEYWFTCGAYSEPFTPYPNFGINTEADEVKWCADQAKYQLWGYNS